MRKKLDLLVEQTENYSASLAKELTTAKQHAMAAHGREFADSHEHPQPQTEAPKKETIKSKKIEVLFYVSTSRYGLVVLTDLLLGAV